MKFRPFINAAVGLALLAGVTACTPEPTPPPPPPPPPTSTVVSSFTDASGYGWQAYSDLGLAQAFVMPATGTVTRVSLALSAVAWGGTPMPVTVQIQGTDSNGFPNGTVLAAGVWNGPLPPTTKTLSDVELTTPVQLQGGTKYAIVGIPPSGGTVAWYLSQNVINPGGASQIDSLVHGWYSISGGPPPNTSLLYQVWAYGLPPI